MKYIEIIFKILGFPFMILLLIMFGIIGMILGHGLQTSKWLLDDYLETYY